MLKFIVTIQEAPSFFTFLNLEQILKNVLLNDIQSAIAISSFAKRLYFLTRKLDILSVFGFSFCVCVYALFPFLHV